MAYSDFTLDVLEDRFGLTFEPPTDLYSHVPEADLPPPLADTLRRYLPTALNLGTEKARSELLVMPLLIEFKLLHESRVTLFSGIDFNVDEGQGLEGRCDYLLSLAPYRLAVTAPVCALVEAKKEDIVGGVPQCLAEMVAAQRFNQSHERPIPAVHGVVTSGTRWRFLRLEGTRASVDAAEYSIENARKIFGILTHIVLGP